MILSSESHIRQIAAILALKSKQLTQSVVASNKPPSGLNEVTYVCIPYIFRGHDSVSIAKVICFLFAKIHKK